MLVKISKKISSHYIKKNNIDEIDREVYNYCFEILLSTIINFIALIVFAVLTKTYFEFIGFSIAFVALRTSVGGYHAKTHWACFLSLMASYGAMVLLVSFMPSNILLYSSIGVMIFSLVSVLILAPVDSVNRRLDKDEKKHYGKNSKIMILILLSIYILLMLFSFTRRVAFGTSIATLAVSIMLWIQQGINVLLQKKEKKHLNIYKFNG